MALGHFLAGSAPAGSPVMDEARFRAHGRVFLVTVKIGDRAWRTRDYRELADLVRSIR
jgi:hypothetical protein